MSTATNRDNKAVLVRMVLTLLVFHLKRVAAPQVSTLRFFYDANGYGPSEMTGRLFCMVYLNVYPHASLMASSERPCLVLMSEMLVG